MYTYTLNYFIFFILGNPDDLAFINKLTVDPKYEFDLTLLEEKFKMHCQMKRNYYDPKRQLSINCKSWHLPDHDDDNTRTVRKPSEIWKDGRTKPFNSGMVVHLMTYKR